MQAGSRLTGIRMRVEILCFFSAILASSIGWNHSIQKLEGSSLR